ncbi:MAG TPA: hypothetical protein VNY51_03765 [Candidatus Dormibacteraeota bacterium]|jgi:hypothetical protein|nr:hypothetical protein [Candidatus Dormibacteraeota bacterium]
MSIDDEQPDVALDISKEAKRTLQAKLASSGVAGVLSLIPGVGAAVSELITELAIERTNNRVKEMFEHFTSKIREVGEDKVDREWFRSEDFQSLLYDALQQLFVTHDHQKIEMLGIALANSGMEGFKEDDRKDLFIRLLRDLTRLHLQLLIAMATDRVKLVKKGESPYFFAGDEDELRNSYLELTGYKPVRNDNLLAIRMLQSYGLVDDSPYGSTAQAPYFEITRWGQDFLQFMGLLKNSVRNGASQKPGET